MSRKLTVGSLFSGIGGFDLGLTRAGFEILWQVEIDEFCRKVLAKHAPEYWPNAKRYNDVKEVSKKQLKPVNLICGGFPCQPFSDAGSKRGKEDNRYLWPEMLRIISELSPRWIIGENVVGFISMELDNALIDLEAKGYNVETFVLPACSIGGWHRRDRVWIVAYTDSIRRKGREKTGNFNSSWQESIQEQFERLPVSLDELLSYQPTICRDDNGLSKGLDKDRGRRIKALGNAVIPQIVEILGRCIMEIENDT